MSQKFKDILVVAWNMNDFVCILKPNVGAIAVDILSNFSGTPISSGSSRYLESMLDFPAESSPLILGKN